MKNFVTKYSGLFFFLVSIFVYFYVAYFLERSNFYTLFSSISVLFFGYFVMLKTNFFSSNQLLVITIVFNLIFVISIPNLSQDFYRFIWDGRMLLQGLNPYLYLPNSVLNTTAIAIENKAFLISKMGNLSASNYSNYPPINQFIFTAGAFLFPKSILGNVVFFKIIILVANLGIVYFGRKILIHLNKNPNLIYWFALNPLVIIELSGNLHFEGVMLCFFIIGMWFLIQNNNNLSAMFIAFSILTKLLPLLFLPLFIKYFSCKKLFTFYMVIAIVFLLFFIPFFSINSFQNYSKTIGLWFTNFEFNASFYNIIKYIGFQVKGYNCIQTIGKITPFIVILFVFFRSLFYKNNSKQTLFKSFFWVLIFYFLISTTIHPWYIVSILLLGIFTEIKFGKVWSYLVFLSYFAYSKLQFQENYLVLFIEYFLLFVFIYFEYFTKTFQKQSIIL